MGANLPAKVVFTTPPSGGVGGAALSPIVVQVQDAQGKVLKEVQARATSGTGQRGTFDLEVPFSVSGSQPGMIVAFDLSAKDGSKIDEVKVPVTLAP